jgi:N-dimethylarginine dimethylaminohydrolase
MSYTCQSETGKLKSVYIKRAIDAFVDEQSLASDWKALNYLSKPDLTESLAEYGVFESLLRSSAVDVFLLPKDEHVTLDSMYCRDATIATDRGMILCNMGKPARRNEPSAQRRVFEAAGLSILGEITDPGTLEGGDVAWLDPQTLAVGHTYRTNPEGIGQLKNLLNPMGVEVIVVPLPHYKGPSDVFHLMSILSPVDKDLAVVYSPLMPISFRNYLLTRGYLLVEVPSEEFESMGCNVLALAPRECLVVSGNPITQNRLMEAGCRVHIYPGNEISVKGGGGPTCLTRPIWRAR